MGSAGRPAPPATLRFYLGLTVQELFPAPAIPIELEQGPRD